MCVCPVAQEGQRTTWRIQFSYSIMWILGIELRLVGLVASDLYLVSLLYKPRMSLLIRALER